ncbi:MAG: hypothetical protein H6Q19_354 [Bacteroidetes bacterium]|nr:hypothetical protein [Bacteroidota bacterium]
MAALSVTTGKSGKMSEYYNKKVAEGKNKMSVISLF